MELAAVAAAPLALVLWQIAMAIHFAELPITRTVAYFQFQGSMIGNIAATFSFVGGVALFPLMTIVAAHRPRRAALFVCAAAALVLGLVVAVPSPAARLWYMVLSGAGLILLASFAGASRNIMQTARNRGEALFILWVPATLLFFIVVADMINARYVLLSLPALYLILFRESDARKLTYALIPTAILSVAIAYADFAFVNAYREWVRQVVGPLQRQGFQLWSASETGLRFYLETAGLETLSGRDSRPRGTDLIVRHQFYRYALSEDTETMLTMLERFPLNGAFPLRTFNWEAGAGYHDSRVGIVPFTFSRLPYDHVEIAQMNPFVKALPQTGIPGDEVPAWGPDGVILKQDVDAREFKMNIPDNCTIEYEVVGEGSVERTADGIILRRLSPGTIVWKRFRIVPSQFQDGK
jgi:hypothetical protein